MYNTLLINDFYKATHLMQFNKKIDYLTSYLTPRSSRLTTTNKMIWFGISGFIDKYIRKDFIENFFAKDWSTIEEEYKEALCKGLGYSEDRVLETLKKVRELYDLNFLPIEIRALPEGTLVPMGVPCLEIRTTIAGFAWVGQAIESLLSCSIWHPCVSATVAYEYAMIAKKAYERTVDDNISWKTAMCDFSLRGQESNESAVASSAAWLTSFYNSSTVHARDYIKDVYWDAQSYNDDGTTLYDDLKIGGLTSTEHSVMTSDYAITGDERETYKRLLTEVYPDVSFAAVCDSYDFWNVLTNILPSLRNEIEAHKGFLGVRHDSAEPVEALCGLPIFEAHKVITNEFEPHDHVENEISNTMIDSLYEFINDSRPEEFCKDCESYVRVIYKTNLGTYDKVYRVIPNWINERGAYTSDKYYFIEDYSVEYVRETTWQDKGMVETMYELFDGTINTKGFKVINPKLKAVYGDSITIPRAREIYRRLEEKGFAANNVSLGVGSFSMEAIEEEGELKPFTRDTFSIAIKATYGILNDGTEIEIYKDPKGFSQKKSLRGLCVVYYNEKGNLVVEQGFDELGRQKFIKDNKITDEFETYFFKGDWQKEGIGKEIKPLFTNIRNKIDDNLSKERR